MAVGFLGDLMTAQMLADSTAMLPWTSRSIITLNNSISGQDAAFILNLFLTNPMYYHWAACIWCGQHVNSTPEVEVANVEAMIDLLGHDKFVIVSGIVDAHTSIYQGPNGSQYLKVIAYNEILRDAYPDQYVDVLGEMVAEGQAEGDAQSVNYLAPPTKYQPTDIHFNSAGWVRAAGLISAKQIELGHLSESELRRQIAASGGI